MTMYELFKAWAKGEVLVSKTRNYHALDAIENFEKYVDSIGPTKLHNLLEDDNE